MSTSSSQQQQQTDASNTSQITKKKSTTNDNEVIASTSSRSTVASSSSSGLASSSSGLSKQQALHKQPTNYRKEQVIQRYTHSSDDEDDDDPDLQAGIQQSLRFLGGNPPNAPTDKLPNFELLDMNDVGGVIEYLTSKGYKRNELTDADTEDVGELFTKERKQDIRFSSKNNFFNRLKVLSSKYSEVLDAVPSNIMKHTDPTITSHNIQLTMKINNQIIALAQHATTNCILGENIEINELIFMLSSVLNMGIQMGLLFNFEAATEVINGMINPTSLMDLFSKDVEKKFDRIQTQKILKPKKMKKKFQKGNGYNNNGGGYNTNNTNHNNGGGGYNDGGRYPENYNSRKFNNGNNYNNSKNNNGGNYNSNNKSK